MSNTNTGIEVLVTGPNTGETRRFSSITNVARMLSGNGTASGSFRNTIREAGSSPRKADRVVRNNMIKVVL